MKKVLMLLLLAFAMHFSAYSQIIFSENFEGTTGTALPAGWTKMCTGPTEWESGDNVYFTGGAWVISPHTRFVGLNDNDAGAGVVNMTQRLMTPPIDFTASASPAMTIQAAYIESTQWQGEELAIKYSVNNGPWIILQSVQGNTVSNWESKYIDLAPLAGSSNVRIAFEYSDNGTWEFGAMIDDVVIEENAPDNVRILSVNVPEMAVPNSEVSVSVRNMGSNTITSLNLNYSVDGGVPVSQVFTGLNIAPFANYEVTFATAIQALALGVDHVITVNAIQVNGLADTDITDNSADTTFMSATQSVTRAGLIEDFGSSSCLPCSYSAADFDPVLLSNNANEPGANVNVIKYQMDFPGIGDRNYNLQAASRRSYYNVNAIPALFINGKSDNDDNQAGIDKSKADQAFVTITGSYIVDGDSLRATASMTPYFTSDDSFHVRLAFVQRHFTLDTNDIHQLTGQTDFYHVMRRATMFTLFAGIIANQTYNFNYAIDYSVGNVEQDPWNFNFWSHPINTDLVIFLQGWPSKKVYQSVVVPAAWPTDVKQIANELKVMVFPNPATDIAAIALNMNREADVRIIVTDASGKQVYCKNARPAAGRNDMLIDTQNFPSGIYFVNIQTDKGTVTEKLSIIK